MAEILMALVIFSLYLFLRFPYFQLPLGPDTGFYVSNHTILSRKFSFSKGWNARYALCSKFFPEAFCSLIYIRSGEEKYKFSWRFFFSIYNFATGVAVGGIVHVLTPGQPWGFLAGLLAFCLVSSEPDYGIYYESAEQFEILFQAWGTLFILWGMDTGRTDLLLIAAGFWLADIFFVKITAIAAAAPILIGFLFFRPDLVTPFFIESGVFLLLYLLLFIGSNRNPLATIRSEKAHQSFYSRNGQRDISVLRGWVRQLKEKARQITQIWARNPVVPLLAVMGTLWLARNSGERHLLFLSLYALGVGLKLMVSFLPIWWYSIPLLPLLGIFAGLGAFEAAGAGLYGKALLLLLFGLWMAIDLSRTRAKDAKSLVLNVWKLHPEEGKIHWDLEQMTPELKKITRDGSFFVYGFPSLCAMVGRSYNVNFLTGIQYLDEMNPKWHEELHRCMAQDPPAYIFDMFGRFNAEAVKRNLGLGYEEIRSWRGECDFCAYKLYRLKSREEPEKVVLSFRSCEWVPDGIV